MNRDDVRLEMAQHFARGSLACPEMFDQTLVGRRVRIRVVDDNVVGVVRDHAEFPGYIREIKALAQVLDPVLIGVDSFGKALEVSAQDFRLIRGGIWV